MRFFAFNVRQIERCAHGLESNYVQTNRMESAAVIYLVELTANACIFECPGNTVYVAVYNVYLIYTNLGWDGIKSHAICRFQTNKPEESQGLRD